VFGGRRPQRWCLKNLHCTWGVKDRDFVLSVIRTRSAVQDLPSNVLTAATNRQTRSAVQDLPSTVLKAAINRQTSVRWAEWPSRHVSYATDAFGVGSFEEKTSKAKNCSHRINLIKKLKRILDKQGVSLWWRAPQQMLRTHRSLKASCASVWWRERCFFLFLQVMEHWWNEIFREKPKYSGKNLSQYHFVHHQSHMDTQDRTRVSAVGGRRLTAWAMALPTRQTGYLWVRVLLWIG
jgi:hypothetical protein